MKICGVRTPEAARAIDEAGADFAGLNFVRTSKRYVDPNDAGVIVRALGDVLPDAHLAAITATGGLLLVGVALRLLRIREVPVADLLPALLVAPLLVSVVAAVR